VAAKKVVRAPTHAINCKIVGTNSKKNEHLIIKKIPAVTMVAACISADTGVGPSIASGSQTCNPICADFPMEPIKKNKQIVAITEK
jgi:hypothetical protein